MTARCGYLREFRSGVDVTVCSKPKLLREISLTEIHVWWLLSGKTKIFISVLIEYAGGLDYPRLKEYTWIPFTLMATNLDRLKEPVRYFT